MAPRTTGTHECPGGCGKPVSRNKLACRACWYRLPADLRQPINATYGRDAAAHRQAMADALRWYREQRAVSTSDGGR